MTREARLGFEDAHAVAPRAAGEALAGFVRAVDKHLFDPPDELGRAAQGILLEDVEQDLIAAFFHLVGHLLRQRGGRRAGADRILENVGHIEVARSEQVARLLEIRVGFARKSHNHVSGKIHVGPHRSQRLDDFAVAIAGVGPVHRAENAIAAGLHRQVHVAAKFFEPAIGGHEIVPEAARVR